MTDFKRVSGMGAIALSGLPAFYIIQHIYTMHGEALANGIKEASALLTASLSNINTIIKASSAASQALAASIAASFIPVFPVSKSVWPSLFGWRTPIFGLFPPVP
jgi:GTPase